MAREAPAAVPVTAAARWAEQLGAWAIPDEILAAARESPWALPPSQFAVDRRRAAAGDDTPTRRAALEALASGGTVLDVGAGAGAASLPLAPPATHVTAVDESAAMLEAFVEEARRRGVDHRAHRGRWPDEAGGVEGADVVVCHHVLYNVPDIEPFLLELTAHAARRVVVELTDRHPHAALVPLWRRFHGLDRPDGPTADDLVLVLGELGIGPQRAVWDRPARGPLTGEERADVVAFTRRRLCLTAERDPEIDDALGTEPAIVPGRIVGLWWDA